MLEKLNLVRKFLLANVKKNLRQDVLCFHSLVVIIGKFKYLVCTLMFMVTDSAQDLVQRLRTCFAEERKAAAIELAKTETNEAVAELIRMAEGRRRYWLSWYTLDDQLIGVEALGESRSKNALEYLHILSQSKSVEARRKWIPYRTSMPTPQSAEVYRDCFPNCFPNAKGELRNVLERSYHGSRPSTILIHYSDTYSKSIFTRKLIQSSIQKLESSLQNAPPNP